VRLKARALVETLLPEAERAGAAAADGS
jgi:hypothetical protein